jgi:hypothetical protein
MPFGKHRDRPLDELPDAYLDWLLSIRLREPLLSAVNREAARRAGEAGGSNGGHAGPRRLEVRVDPAIAHELVTAGLHVLTKRHHPDLGGDLEIMKRVNLVAEALRRIVAGRRGNDD